MSGNRIELKKAQFPYLVRQDDAPIESVIVISHPRFAEASERTLFYLANAELQVESDRERGGLIKVNHTWARDDEDDTAKIGYFHLSSVEFMSSWGGHLNFRAWLTEVPEFYPAEVKDPNVNPYIGAKRKPGRTQHGYSKNTGFPYTPPKVLIPGFRIPLQVEVSVVYGAGGEKLERWIKRAMRSHAKARREREAQERQRAKEQAEKARQAAERRAREAEWIKTSDGQEYISLRAEMKKIEGYQQRQLWMEKTESGQRYAELVDALYALG